MKHKFWVFVVIIPLIADNEALSNCMDLQQEANLIIRASIKRRLFDGLFLLNTLVSLGLAGFFILNSRTAWLNYRLFMMIGAMVVLSLDFANDYAAWRREGTATLFR